MDKLNLALLGKECRWTDEALRLSSLRREVPSDRTAWHLGVQATICGLTIAAGLARLARAGVCEVRRWE